MHTKTSRSLNCKAEAASAVTSAGWCRGHMDHATTSAFIRHAILLILCSLVFLLSLLLSTNTACGSDVDKDKLIKLKAAYVFNLLKFTHWSEDKFDDDKSPVKVIFVGNSPVAKVFKKAVEDRTVQGRVIETSVLPFPPPGYDDIERTDDEKQALLNRFHHQLHTSHMVYISDGLAGDWPMLRELTSECQTLLVSDINRFAEDGGMVGLSLDENNRLGFVVNQDTLEQRGLRLGSSLMKLAKVVKRSQSMLDESGTWLCVWMLSSEHPYIPSESVRETGT